MKTDIETLNEMAIENKEIYLFPLENILEISNLDEARAKMKMLIDSGVARKMLDGKMVGAFIVADKEQFYKIKRGGTKMPEKEKIEELDEEDIEVEIDTRFNLLWICPNCKTENSEYDISPEETIKCVCEECGKEYEYYGYSPY